MLFIVSLCFAFRFTFRPLSFNERNRVVEDVRPTEIGNIALHFA